MSRRLNWERAKARDRQRISKVRAKSAKLRKNARIRDDLRQQALREFQEKHKLECFGTGPHSDRLAKTGVSKRGPWVICVSCVARHKRENGLPDTR